VLDRGLADRQTDPDVLPGFGVSSTLRRRRLLHRHGTRDRIGRAVEHGHHPVAQGLDLGPVVNG
jgi:hypothetical protein